MKNDHRKKPSVFKNLFKLHWMLLAIFAYSGTIVLGNFLIIRPELQKYKKLEEQKANLDEVYLKIRSTDVEQTINLLQIELEKCQFLERSFKDRVVDKKDFSNVLGELNWIVEKSGVVLKSIDPLDEENKILGKYWKKPIKISFHGSFSQFLSFLKNLEQSHYWLLIDSYNILHNPNDTSKHSYNIIVFTIVL